MKQPVEAFVSYLENLDIKLWREGDRLRCNAPEGTLTPTLRTQLTERKTELLAFIDEFGNGKQLSTHHQLLPTVVPKLAERYQPFPLTDVQQAYWIGRSGDFELSNVSTHAYFEIDTIGLDRERFETAWQRLIERHEMLRMIVNSDGQQQILEQVPLYKIKVVDLCQMNSELVASELIKIRNQLSHQVLPADQWPLFDIQIAQLDQKKSRLYMSIDFLIADGWSLEILLAELAQLVQNPDLDLAPCKLSFRDYVLAESTLQNSTLYHRSRDYWQGRLAALSPSPELPLKKNLATIKYPHFVRRNGKLDSDTWSRLKKKAAEANLTASGILLAAFAEILTVWSKSSRFTINLTLFNRLPLHPEVNQIIGDFTSLNLLAIDNSGSDSFEVRAQRIQKQLWSDLKHLYYSGVKVLRELAQIQNRSSGVLMPVVFTSMLVQDSLRRDKASNLQTDDTPSDKATSVQRLGEPVYIVTQTPQVYLDHQVYEIAGTLDLNWDAVEEVFPPGLLDDMFAAYCDFLNRLANEDELWRVKTRQLLPPAQLNQLVGNNATEVPFVEEALLHTLFFDQAALRPEQLAVVTSHCTLTYQEVSDRARSLGNYLRQLGARPNQLVAIVMEKGWEQVVAALGILTSGAAYLPIDPGLPTERRWHLLEQGKVQWVITQSKLDAPLEWPEGVTRFCLDSITEFPSASKPVEPIQKSSDLAYVIYTSGSTGKPKGVMIDHKGAVNTIVDINQRFNVSSGDRIFGLSSLSFDLSVYDIFGALAAGGTIVLPDANATKDPAHWIRLIAQQQVSVWNSVPALMQMLVDYAVGRSERLPKSLRLVMLSGDWLPLNLPEQIRVLCKDVQIVSLGGATEASIWSILYPIQQIETTWKSIPYGRPMANQHFYVLNDALEACPIWVSGQLYIGGIGLAKGYWEDKEKTNASFIIHPQTQERLYRTGDLGRYLPDGNIEFIGREDFQVKVNGHRIELGEIEANLQQHPAVKDVIVTAVGESRENKQLVAYIIPEAEEKSNLFEVESTDSLDAYKCWESLVKVGCQQAQHDFWHVDPKVFVALWKYQDHVYAISVCKAFSKLNTYHAAGERYSVDDLISRCQIAPRYRKWLCRALNVLVEEGWLQQHGEVYESTISLPTLVSEDLSADIHRELTQGNEFTKVWLDLLDTGVTERLSEILTEKIYSGELYANEELAVNIYQKMFGYCYAIVSELVKVLVQSLDSEKQLRILEVGGGYGSCTQHLLPLLPPNQTTYVFTDIANFFLQRAEKIFADYSFVSYDLLDLDKDPYEQGYESHSFDVIVAISVLHDTRDLQKTLQHLLSLLSPDGLLLIVEETKFHRSFDMHMGLQQGFDVFEDEKLRTNHPLLSRDQWQEILATNGFGESIILNQPDYVSDFIGLDVLVARGPSSVKRFKSIEFRNFLQEKLPKYMIPFDFISLDNLPLTPNGKLDRSALPSLKGRERIAQSKINYVCPQTQNEKLIASIWQEVLQVDRVGIYDNFFELGGDSLLATRVISQISKAFQIELPIANIFEAPTVAGLLEKIETIHSTTSDWQTSPATALDDREEGVL